MPGSTDAAPLAGAFAAAWRRYWVDSLATLILFVAAALAAGRVWRFPFDDEILTMVPDVPIAFRGSVWALARFYLAGGDIHPPFTFVFFSTLYGLGIGEAALHFCSLAMTAGALVLWQLLALAVIIDRRGVPADGAIRLIAILLFGLSPLAIGEGDAIRWYPQFALCIGIFAALYLAAGTRAVRLASAIPLGLATSINLIAPLVILPLAIYRYLLERAWRPLFDTVYWVVFVLFAAPGLYSAIFIAQHQFGWLRRYQFGVNPLLACAVNVLGFFGGNAVGVGHAWILLPAIVLTAVAVVSEIDRCHLANPIHLCLLMLVAMLPVALVGFSESRSFLYLAAVWTLVLTAFVDRTLKRGFDSRGVLLGSCAILPGIAAIGDLGDGAHPFKRTTAIPFDEVIDFVERNEHGDSVVISTNRVASWVLHADAIVSRRCVFILPGPQPGCFAEGRHEQSIFVISERVGHFQYNPYENKGVIRRIAEITQGREKIAELHVGRDEDAMLKTRLTGVPLDEFILTVDFYR